MRRGVTPVIATVLLLMIGVAIAGGVFYWVTNMQGRIQSSVGSQAAQTGTKLTSNVVMVGLIINAFESNITATIHNIGEVPVIAGPASFTVSDRNNLVVRSLVTNLSVNVNQNEFATLSVNVSGSLIVDEVYVVKITFANGLMVTADSVARSFVSQTCASAIECNDGNVCSLDDCVNYVCSFINVPNGPVTGCTGGTGCGVPPCGCAGGSCVTYCTLDGECDDSNACTLDSCSLNSCAHSGLNGQVAGCNTGTNACVSGSCVDTCGNAVCNSGWEDYVNCIIDCPVVCQDVQGDCTGVYFTGTIVTENQNVCACCGDDGFSDMFYNGSIGSTTNFCYLGSYYDTGIDSNQDICDYYDYAWLNSTLDFIYINSITTSGYAMELYDLNNDNYLDLIFYSESGIYSMLGNGDGTFDSLNTISSLIGDTLIRTINLNNDNYIDLSLVNSHSGSITHYTGDGDGTFTQVSILNYPVRDAKYDDINGDGKNDLVIVNYGDDIKYWLGNGDGTFSSLNTITDSLGQNVLLNDINQDGDIDIIISQQSNGIKSFIGNSDGTFVTGSTIASDSQLSGIVAADLNEDGYIDIMATWYRFIILFTGNGDGSFDTPIQIAQGTTGGELTKKGIKLSDINNDNKLDILVSTTGWSITYGDGNYAHYLLGNGDGTFEAIQTAANAGSWTYSFAIGDINNDDSIDLIVGTSVNDAPIFLNNFYSACCGDDGASDDFHTSLLSIASNFCIDGVSRLDSVDSNKNLCEYYGSDWVSNVDSVISFSNDDEGASPSELRVYTELADDNPNVTERVVDYYKGRFKVTELLVVNDSSGPEPLTLYSNRQPLFTSGNASLDFWINIPRMLTNNSFGEASEFAIGLGNINEIFEDNALVLSFNNQTTTMNTSFRNGPGMANFTILNNFLPDTWYNYHLDILKDEHIVKLYRDGSLLATKDYVSSNPLDTLLLFLDRGSKDDKVYLDGISFNWSTGNSMCCGDDSSELFGNRTHYCSAGTINPYTGAWYTGCSAGATVINLDGKREFNRNDTLMCGCDGQVAATTVINPSFNDNLTGWTSDARAGNFINVTTSNYATSPYSLYLQSNNPNLEPQVSASTNFNYESGPLTFNYYGHVNSSIWNETQPAGVVDTSWRSTAISLDGSSILASGWNNRLYNSTDGGVTWSELRPHGLDQIGVWLALSMNNSGTNLIAGKLNGRLYNSSDNGVTWSELRPHNLDENRNWKIAEMSTNGSNIIVGTSSVSTNLGRLYNSSDGGVTWSETRPAGDTDRQWYSAVMDANGTKILVSDGHFVYNSSDSGLTWSTTNIPGGDKIWRALAMSSDGNKIIAGADGYLVYLSNDGGSTWSEVRPHGSSETRNWETASMSSNGNNIIIGNRNAHIYQSVDGGIIWSDITPSNELGNWFTSSISADGSKMIIGAEYGGIYLAQSAMSFSGVMVGPDDDNAIYYILFNNGVSNAGYCCPDFSAGCINTCGANIGGNSYIYCVNMTSFTQNVWNTIALNISDNFMECNGLNINNTEVGLSAAVFGTGNAYFDDFTIRPTTDGHYCDAGNNEGLADGVCYAGACVKPYINSFDEDFLFGDNVIINASFTNFTRMTSCTLNFDGVDYAMTLNNNYAIRELSTYPFGEYTAVVTCTEQAGSFSRTENINVINWDDTEILFSNCDRYSIDAYDEKISAACRAYGSDLYYKYSTNKGETWTSGQNIGNGESIALSTTATNVHALFLSGSALYYKNSSNNGATWSSPYLLTNMLSTNDAQSIGSDGNHVLISFRDNRAGNDEIYFKNSSDNGATFTTDFRLTFNSAWSAQQDMSVYGSNAHIVWTDTRLGNQNLYYLRSNDYGFSWYDEQLLSATIIEYPKISASGSNIHVVWRNSGAGSNLYYKNSSDNGVSWNSDYALVTSSTNNPVISASGSNVYVAWVADDGRNQIFFKYSTDNGGTWSETEQLSTTTDFSSGMPVITSYGADVYLLWFGDNNVFFKKGKF